ncbi:MAG: hypothetical protein AAGH79_03530 [Bacteroidota bacterium]
MKPLKQLTTIHTLDVIDLDSFKDYNYQAKLTEELDALDQDFDQAIINKIVLWKVNRYAHLTEDALELLNQIRPSGAVAEKRTKAVLKNLLDITGIRLPMASTILRFRNPHHFQILDQRVYRFLYGKPYHNTTVVDDQINGYLSYLEQLKVVCHKKNIPFHQADRILYMMDIKYNKEYKIKY